MQLHLAQQCQIFPSPANVPAAWCQLVSSPSRSSWVMSHSSRWAGGAGRERLTECVDQLRQYRCSQNPLLRRYTCGFRVRRQTRWSPFHLSTRTIELSSLQIYDVNLTDRMRVRHIWTLNLIGHFWIIFNPWGWHVCNDYTEVNNTFKISPR